MWITRKRFAQLEQRILDMERHFAVERDPKTGAVTKSLADVPIEERAKLRKNVKMSGRGWPQIRRWLEETDGGRNTSAYVEKAEIQQ